MKQKLKRILTFVLCLSMMLQLSVIPAAAATGDDYYPTAIQDLSELASDYSGFIVRYNAPEAGSNVIRLDIGVKNLKNTSSLDFGFRYDPSVVKLANYKSGTIAAVVEDEMAGEVSGTDKQAIVVPLKYPESVIKSSVSADLKAKLLDSYMFTNAGAGITATYSSFTLQDGTTIDIGYDTTNKTFNGDLMFPLTVSAADGYKNSLSMIAAASTLNTQNVVDADGATVPVYFASVYFIADDITKVTDKTFRMQGLSQSETGAVAVDGTAHTTDIRFLGFPLGEEPKADVTFTVTNGTDPLPNAVLTLSGTSKRDGTAIADLYTEKQRTTNENGQVTLSLPYGDSYNYKVGSVSYNGKTYTMTSDTWQPFKVGTGEGYPNAYTYTNMIESTVSYEFTVKAVDASGNPVSLKDSALKFGSKEVETAEASDSVTFTISESNSLNVTLSGVQGYQNASGSVIVTPGSEPNTATITNAGAFAVDTAGTTLTITLKPVETKVTMEIPVPTVDGGNIGMDKAEDITVTFKPVDGTGSITGTVTPVDTDDDGVADSVIVDASLPDGEYTMTVGGAGIESKETTVTVKTTYDETDGTATPIVNIGGKLEEAEDGSITATGGVTAVGGTPDNNTGNSTMDLTGADKENTTITDAGKEGEVTITTGGDVTPGEGTTDITESGTGSSGTITDNLGTTAVTDPIYEVHVEAVESTTSSSVIDSFKVSVYLKNAEASSGTFGLYFDPAIFDSSTLTGDSVVFNEDLNVQKTTSLAPAVEVYNTSGYVLFGWQVAPGKDALDAINTTEKNGLLIATVDIPVKGENKAVALLETMIDDRSIYTMDFVNTKEYKKLIDTAQPKNDAELNEAMGGTWRPVESAGTTGSIHLEDAKATRGGFYQIGALGEKGYEVSHDIRMQFVLDPLIQNSRADFYVTEPDTGKAIVNATIEIFATPLDDPENPPATVVKPFTTDSLGYAHAPLKDGQYYYRVTENGHWAYPDGSPTTESDGIHYGGFELLDGVIIPTENVFPAAGGTHTKTPIVDDYLNPRMAPKTFHIVEVVSTDASTLNAKITSDNEAENGVDYYFTLTPGAGYEWADGVTMEDIATELTANAKMYEADATASDLIGAFRTKNPKAMNVEWVPEREQFKIAGDTIDGNPIDVTTIGTETVKALRAGDIVLTLDPAKVKFADYKITATAGTGGHVSWVEDTSLSTGLTDLTGKTGTTDVTEVEGSIVETISEGRTTSGTFNFATQDADLDPEDRRYIISTVTINGVDLPITDEQKKAGTFSYQFTGVSADQNIYVTFAQVDGPDDPDPTPVSQAQIEVIVGANGSADVKVNDADATPLNVPASSTGIYYVDGGDKVSVIAKPADGAVVDTIMVDGVDVTDTLTDNTAILDNILASATHTVVITFKPEGKDSTHVIVSANIEKGFGTLVPIGVAIYPVNSKPSYNMTPAAGWKVVAEADSGAVVVNGVDDSARITTTDNTVYTYELAPVTKDTTVAVSFAELTHTVHGLIKVVAAVDSVVKEADIIFVRAADPDTQTDETTVTFTSEDTVLNGQLLDFHAEIPAGTWSVTVKKQGYLDYTINGFYVDPEGTNAIYFGDTDGENGKLAGTEANMKAIELTAGDAAGEGIAIGFNDASVVVAGWLPNALTANKIKGNIDESDAALIPFSNTTDIGYVAKNMYKTRTNLTDYYADFCSAGASTAATE